MTDDVTYCPECAEEIDDFDNYWGFCDSDCYNDFEGSFEEEGD